MRANLSVFLLGFLAAVAGLVILCVLILFLARESYPSPEAALAAFYGGEPRPECMQANPLRSEGQRVVPLLLRELPNKSMPRRRYAIGFLGEGRYEEALPALERILADLTEIDYFRADALLAIYAIAPARAKLGTEHPESYWTPQPSRSGNRARRSSSQRNDRSSIVLRGGAVRLACRALRVV